MSNIGAECFLKKFSNDSFIQHKTCDVVVGQKSEEKYACQGLTARRILPEYEYTYPFQ